MGTAEFVDRNRVAYLDYTGSRNETARHSIAGGPIAVMVCAFEQEDAATNVARRSVNLLDGSREQLIEAIAGATEPSARYVNGTFDRVPAERRAGGAPVYMFRSVVVVPSVRKNSRLLVSRAEVILSVSALCFCKKCPRKQFINQFTCIGENRR